MVKYCKEPTNNSKAAKAKGVDLRVHFKNTYEVGTTIKGMSLSKAQKYLEAVLKRQRCVPFRKFTGCIGRTAQAKEWGYTQGRWPVKSVKIFLGLLKNAESNAEFKGLDTENVLIKHVCVQRAQKGRRRTYRAHGRINAYMSSPCHVELILEEKPEDVEKPTDIADKKVVRLTRKQKAIMRLTAGTGH
uniref:60S ribosomal protein L17 n=1 Tax=Chromera velia CCMP2878 TaxID=1169474 RepID=A0A0G4FQT2_9ALVE|eukprot:Cvel_18223.t1-p1 / transcript=Cvel_18223.t1 / gene=Cvel_18223 / organism=Chromera_velia_CCMP2878 / gene_product=60S ribosomal protein L17, putative / transcript_product=60S ribosomal protein L17, putative / location=Cvel_scaffold1497:24295-24855(+) / protein_length=187 / sequence_SO=supercontig / SO=protein_coding / is_pseudo=false